MEGDKNRKFVRQESYQRQKILNLVNPQVINEEFALSKNISASGVCVRSKRNYQPGDYVVIRLDPKECQDLDNNKAHVVKMGPYVLGEIKWSSPTKDGYFENGVAFLQQKNSNQQTLDLFVQLLNQDVILNLS